MYSMIVYFLYSTITYLKVTVGAWKVVLPLTFKQNQCKPTASNDWRWKTGFIGESLDHILVLNGRFRYFLRDLSISFLVQSALVVDNEMLRYILGRLHNVSCFHLALPTNRLPKAWSWINWPDDFTEIISIIGSFLIFFWVLFVPPLFLSVAFSFSVNMLTPAGTWVGG